MAQSKKSGREVKAEVNSIIDIHIEGFKDVEPDSTYFDGYRAGLKAMKENMEKIDVGEDDEDKDSKVKLL